MSPVSTIRASAWGNFQTSPVKRPRFIDANASIRLDTRRRASPSPDALLLICAGTTRQARDSALSLLSGAGATGDCWLSAGGGALSPLGRPGGPSAKRLTGAVGALSDGACARAPGLISVHGPGWLRVGDMMVAGVIPQEALRPLGLSGPSTRAWRREHAGSRPRGIGVMRGCARMNRSVRRAPAPPRRVRAGCGSCA